MLGRLGNELQIFVADRFGNRIGSGVNRDLKLLAPQPGLPGF